MSIGVDAAGLAAARQVGDRLRAASRTLHDDLPADDAARQVQQEAATLARSARHGLTGSLRVSIRGSRFPVQLTGTAAAGLGTSAEYGSTRRAQYATYTRRGHRVRRRTRAQLPPASRGGYVITPALTRTTPAIVRAMSTAAADHYQNALGG